MDERGIQDYLFQTNIPPSETERRLAQKVARKNQGRYDRLTDEIERLSRRRDEIDERLHRFKNIISVARVLPPEIVTKVFLSCNDLGNEDDIISSRGPPLLLAQICSGWRKVALQTSELWKCIGLEIRNGMTSKVVNGRFELARLFIARCTDLPFSLFITVSSLDLSIDLLADITMHKRQHIQRLSLFIHERYLSFFNGLPSSCFPRLSELTVEVTELEQPSTARHIRVFPQRTLAFNPAPKLKSLTFRMRRVTRVILNPQSLPWQQLLVIDLSAVRAGVSGENMHQILAHCSCLQDLQLTLAPDLSEPVHGAEPLTVDRLEAISVTVMDYCGVDFFSNMTLPNLQALSIALSDINVAMEYEEMDHMPLRPIVHLLERSSCRLKSFSLSGIEYQPSECLEMLQQCRFLQSLALIFTKSTTMDIVFALTYSAESGHLYPLLQQITLDVSNFLDGGIETVKSLVKSRGYPDLAETAQSKRSDKSLPSTLELLELHVGHVGHEQEELAAAWEYSFQEYSDRGLLVNVRSR